MYRYRPIYQAYTVIALFRSCVLNKLLTTVEKEMKFNIIMLVVTAAYRYDQADAAPVVVNLTATNMAQNFSTPSYPTTSYPNDADLEWRIQAPENYLILVTYLGGTTESCCDFIRMIDGTETFAEFSGILTPGTSRISKSNNLRITFTSDDSTSYSGFLAQYRAVSCGRNIPVTNLGILTSVNWPNNYLNNQDCYWVLYDENRKQIQFKTLEGRTQDQGDYIEVFNGLSSLGRRGGIISEEIYASTNATLLINFKSNRQGTNRGFRAQYQTEPCGFNASASSTVALISSPFYPSGYGIDLSCEWNLNAKAGSLINVTFIASDTEDCCDKITFLEGDKVVKTISGNVPAGTSITSKSNHLRITFTTDSSGSGPGFQLSYVEIDPTPNELCGGSFTFASSPFNFSTPSYPQSYQNNLMCQWEFKSRENANTKITILKGNTQQCCDIIKVFDEGEEKLRKSGAIQQPASWTSGSNSLIVTFNSDSTIPSSGFVASFEEVFCGSIIIVSSTTASQYLAQPDNYHNNECVWLFKTGEGLRVDLELTPQFPNCCEYIKIEESNFVYMITQASGQQNHSYRSHGNEVKIMIRAGASGSLQYTGVIISYRNV